MTEAETDSAISALKAWFISQDINPADAGIMMIKLQAELFTSKTRDLNKLQEAINSSRILLSIEIAGFLR